MFVFHEQSSRLLGWPFVSVWLFEVMSFLGPYAYWLEVAWSSDLV